MEDIQCTMNHCNKQQSQEMMLQLVFEANSTMFPIIMTPAITLDNTHTAVPVSLTVCIAD